MDTGFLLPIFRGSHKTGHLHCIYRVSDEKVELSDQILEARPGWVDGDWRCKCKLNSDAARRGANRLYRSHVYRTHLTSDFHLPAMVSQDKKTTEANTRALRELLKQPDNKVCADCKRNGASHPTINHPPLIWIARPTLGLVEYVRAGTRKK